MPAGAFQHSSQEECNVPEDDRLVRETTNGSSLYLIVGALVVAMLVGAYVLMGTPGLHTQIAKAPSGGRSVDAPVQQQTAAEPATAAPRSN